MKLRRLFPRLLWVALLLCVVVAVAWKVVVAQIGAAAAKDVELLTGIVFGRAGERELKLDLTRPRATAGLRPVLLCIHGGGWTGGAREDLHPLMFGFSKAGILCASLDYRLTPRDRFPAQIEDVKCAVRWLRANASDYGIDPDRIGAFGISAGAHLAALLATTADVAEFEGTGGHATESSVVRAAICLAGPYDLALGFRSSERQLPSERDTIRKLLPSLLGGTPAEAPEMYRRASPITYASQTSPPMLLVHGETDPLVLIEQAEVFTAKLREAGASVQFLRLPRGTHNSFGPDQDKALRTIAAFAREQLQAGGR